MKFTEGGFKDWGYEVATTQFREHTVTQRESWIIGNADKGIKDVVENCKQIEPGMYGYSRGCIIRPNSSWLQDMI
jgi:isocitrate dehydrogenase